MARGESFGRYVLLKRLGSGAMGDVHLARATSSASPLVIKRLHGRLSSDPLAVRRFRHEAELASFVSSPHVAKVFDAGVVGDTFFIAMEYIDGWPLSRVIHELTRRVELPSITAAVRMIEGALEGLEALHRGLHPQSRAPLQIVHRDVAPKNIMVGSDGRARLIDLGIGRSNARDWKTRTGLTVGTPGYMAPEQIFGDAVDHRADIYAAGVVLFELLTLSFYIERGSIGEMLHASRIVRPRAPSSIRGDVPPALDAIVMKAVALDPDHRFASAADMLAALHGVVPAGDDAAILIDDLLWTELEEKRTEVRALVQDTAILDTLASGPASELQPPKRRIPKWVMALVMVFGAFIGVALANLRKEDPIAAPVPLVERIEEPAAAPAVSAIERKETKTAPRPGPKAKRKTTAKIDLPAPPPSPRVDPPPIDPSDLIARAASLKRRVQGTALEKEIDAILREINLGMGAATPPDWTAIERRLSELTRKTNIENTNTNTNQDGRQR